MVGAGGRFGDFTPMLTHTRYRERNRFTPDAIQHDRGWSATLRYELGTSSALKVQWDHFKDLSGTDLSYVGTSKLLSVALDTVF
jgi:hypothetical protein